MFKEAYVQEVLIDPTIYPFANGNDPKAEKPPENKIFGQKIKKGELTAAPYNSCIVRLVEDAGADELLAYPLLQGHISLPIKAGEHVWVVDIGSRTFWLCRRNFDQRVDDVSLAWGGRYQAQNPGPEDSVEGSEAASGEKTSVPPNQNSKLNEKFPVEKKKPEDVIFKDFWSERSKHNPEPVPVYKKRPGDFVIQGSNNTLICLGTGGGHKKEDTLKLDTPSLSGEKNKIGHGTIDIVAGRGRYAPAKPTSEAGLGDEPIRTAPYKVISEFEYVERDKNLKINNKDQKENLVEGDADFFLDASRLYISVNSEVDTDFSLVPNYPKIPKVLGVKPETVDATKSVGAGIVMKSDNIRLISRYHVYGDVDGDGVADGADVNGNIRIVKEGVRDGDGHSATDGKGASLISLESDGTVMIDGATIVIGTGRELENGAGDQIFLGIDATEPIVLGNQLRSVLEKFWDALEKFISTKFDQHIHPVGSGACSPPTGFTGDKAGTDKAKEEIVSILSKIGKTK